MGIFALYDTVSIQKYIYSSNRLRDNQGASALVERCFSQLLINAVKEEAEEGTFSKISVEWETNPQKVGFAEDPEIDCEVLYIGGGNALLYFKDESGVTWKKVNERFSCVLLAEMPGLSVVTEIEKNTGDFGIDLDQLFKKLQLKKYESRGAQDAQCLSVTRECSQSGKPAVAQGADGNWIAEEIIKKREASVQEISKTLYKEIGDLAGMLGEQWVAVVHIDGNRMGDAIRRLTKEPDVKKGIAKLREFSMATARLYDVAYEKMKIWCADWIQESTDSRMAVYKEKREPPFRKIYGAGDDLTFICYGPLAIQSAEQFLKNLEKEREQSAFLKETGIPISACAGIAFAKPGYPFSKAYEIAEACCRSAKKRTINEMGSYLDFQIIYGGLDSLRQMREKQTASNGRIMLRPYRTVSTERDELKNFYLISEWIAGSGIARSKWKELRNASEQGEKTLGESVGRLRRRYNRQITELFSLLNENHVLTDASANTNDIAVLWDGLEMMDLYIRGPKANKNGEAKNETDN